MELHLALPSYKQMTNPSYRGVVKADELHLPEHFHQRDLDLQHGQPHSDTLPRSEAKCQEGDWVDFRLVLPPANISLKKKIYIIIIIIIKKKKKKKKKYIYKYILNLLSRFITDNSVSSHNSFKKTLQN